MRVIYVDDEVMQLQNFRLTAAELSRIDSLETFSRSEDAYEWAKNNPVDVAFLDIEMPVMNGYEATMRIRKFPNRIRANIPIIALTANVFPEDRERAMNVGMDDFLAKPVSPARLLGSLARFC